MYIHGRYLDHQHYINEEVFFVHGVQHWTTDIEQAKELFFTTPYSSYTVSPNTTDTEWFITHYWSRSVADFLVKLDRGLVSRNKSRKLEDLLFRETQCRKRAMMSHCPSARRRQALVRHVLNQINGYKEIQNLFYNEAMKRLQLEGQADVVKEFEAFLKTYGEVIRDTVV